MNLGKIVFKGKTLFEMVRIAEASGVSYNALRHWIDEKKNLKEDNISYYYR